MRRLLALLLLVPALALGAPGFDAFTASATTTGNKNFTHTPTGTPRGVVIYVVIAGTTTDEVTTVDYGSVTGITQIAEVAITGDLNENGIIFAYFVGASVPTGAQTVNVTYSVGTRNNVVYVYTLTGAADLEVVANQTLDDEIGQANPSVSLGLGGRSSFASIVWWSGTNAVTGVTERTGWTSRNELDPGSAVAGTYSYDTIDTADVTAGYDAAAEQAGIIGLAVAEVQAGGGCVDHTMMGFTGCF